MSFVFTITLSNIDAINRNDLKNLLSSGSIVELHLLKPIFANKGTILSVEKKGQGSGGFLTDNADPNAKYWDMNKELLQELGRLLKILRQDRKSAITLYARWIGEQPCEQKAVTIDEMVRAVEEGKIGIRVEYLILP